MTGRLTRAGHLSTVALLALSLAACSAAATPSPTPTAIATATPAPAATPRPTFTPDDEKIASLMRDTVSEVTRRTSIIGGNPADWASLRDYAKTQDTRVSVYPPACTKAAVTEFRASLAVLQSVSQAFVDWVAGGVRGTFDPSGARAGGLQMGNSIQMLNAACL